MAKIRKYCPVLLLALFALAAGRGAFGSQSLTLQPGVRALIGIPAAAPFTNLGDTRVEFRLHDWMAVPANTVLLDLRGLRVTLFASGELCVFNDKDASPDYGGLACADITASTDVSVRVQRDTTLKETRYEVRDTATQAVIATYCGYRANGTQINTFPCPIRAVHRTSWEGVGSVGNPSISARLAWVKWHSTLAPAGAPLSEWSPADLADWRFEGTANNTSTGENKPVLDFGASALTFGSTPIYAPACDAGQPRTFRAGDAANALDGSRSFSLNDSEMLHYAWSGPPEVEWSSDTSPEPRRAASPTVKGLLFGTHVFHLTVTDSEGRSSACTVRHGAVATDSNDIVITGDDRVDALLGPLVRFGASPWPWMDDRNKAAADMQIANLDTYYGAFWDVPGNGTVQVTTNSTVLVGSGTSFTTTFCQGPDNPTVRKTGSTAIIVWYRTGNGEETGRRMMDVSGCVDDEHLTLTYRWVGVPDGADFNYTYYDDSIGGTWRAASAPVNYYDNVMGFYSLYYRTGDDTYLEAARKLADRFWTSPTIDRGAACGVDTGFGCFPARAWSSLGLVLRALDGRPDMWPGLRILGSSGMYVLNAWRYLWDIREQAYYLSTISYLAMFDPDEDWRSRCKAAISASFANIWTPRQAADGSWPVPHYGYASWTPTVTSVQLTPGSVSVTGEGTNWTASAVDGKTIWFTNAPGQPASNADGDPVTYTARFVSPTDLILDRPYEGAEGTHGWMVAASGGQVGLGAQPFMMGILGTAFSFAAQAIADSDPATAEVARSYTVAAANWIRTYGYWPLRKGTYYFAQFVNCQAPIADSNTLCTAGYNEDQARSFNAEVLRAIGLAYLHTGDPALREFGDELCSAMFSKPGSGGPNADGYYVNSLNDVTGWYMIGTPPVGKAPKWFGVFFGFGDAPSWPGYRVGGWRPREDQTIYMGYRGAAVPYAAGVRMTVTAPSGKITQTTCTASPCAITVDRRQGAHRVQLEYLSATGAVLSSSQRRIIVRP